MLYYDVHVSYSQTTMRVMVLTQDIMAITHQYLVIHGYNPPLTIKYHQVHGGVLSAGSPIIVDDVWLPP